VKLLEIPLLTVLSNRHSSKWRVRGTKGINVYKMLICIYWFYAHNFLLVPLWWCEAVPPSQHMGTLSSCPGAPLAQEHHVNLYGMFIHWFCWKYQYNKYMFKFIDSFIPVSGCVGMDHSALPYTRANNVVKTALVWCMRISYSFHV
jgi:hypothetical protein